MIEERQLTNGPGPLMASCPKAGCSFSAYSLEWRKVAVGKLTKHFKTQHPSDYGPKPLHKRARAGPRV